MVNPPSDPASSGYSIVLVTPGLLPVIQNLLQLYVYDYTDFMDWDVEDDGRFFVGDLERLDVPGREILLLKVDGAIAGFAIVDQPDPPQAEYSVDLKEFFVMRRFRRRGLGTWFARQVFDRFRGRWRVEQLIDNKAAIAFWRRVVGAYTGGAYREMISPYGDNVQYFDNSQRPPG